MSGMLRSCERKRKASFTLVFTLICMQFYFIKKKMKKDFMSSCSKSPHVRRFHDALTDVGMVQFTTTMAYDNLIISRRLQFRRENQSQCYRSKDKIPEL